MVFTSLIVLLGWIMNNNYKTQKTFTVYSKVHNDFVQLCKDNGLTASQVISNLEYMYVVNHALLQSQSSDIEVSKGCKNYGR